MIPCGGIAFFLTILFIKKVSLKRDDDAARKAEGKAWVEAKKAKHHKEKHGDKAGEAEIHDTEKAEESKKTRQDSIQTVTGSDVDKQKGKREVVEEVKRELSEAGRGEDEAAGMVPSAKEGFEQGPVGTRV